MEFLVPLSPVRIGDRVLSNARASISSKYVFIIGVGPDGSYEERLMEISSDDAKQVISGNMSYFRDLLDKLDELVINIGHEVGVDIKIRNTSSGDPIQYLINRLSNHDEYLRFTGDGWRRILDSIGLGRTSKGLTGSDRIYVTHSGNNITLNLVAEPIEGGVIEVTTYTEGKATGIVRVRAGEDVVVKTDIRSPSSLIILSQVRDPHQLGEGLADLLINVRGRVINAVNELLSIMRTHGAVP
ncbi:hypothetical protein [Vulcanisaeta souniana]|uniref:Uncharacterized protein n=1 Tax=Vulcanisaeta souniana JCM 11219 TaxID=1293586 RepID=A0A830EJW0_9CREN|nr:hypothetical protein [Vulcanisaeta souniana]BDR92738.1 hypothetical protein Vsou_18310 [Vulcanisaeta souniana JCM 11219]GGI84070.1 hypothetical protein GCM10007112_21190 [Vulcanisaeta souniana JCM 11219]